MGATKEDNDRLAIVNGRRGARREVVLLVGIFAVVGMGITGVGLNRRTPTARPNLKMNMWTRSLSGARGFTRATAERD
jgi:hypothetical protein